MFTKNWYIGLASHMAQADDLKGAVNYNGASGVPSYKPGNSDWIKLNSSGNYYLAGIKTLQTSPSNGGAILGTGTTLPTINDYKLSGDVISGYSYTANTSYESDDNGCKLKAVYTITNNGDTDITIGEIGLLGGIGSGNMYLIERTVLDSPVTIEPGSVGQVTYEIRINYPWAATT